MIETLLLMLERFVRAVEKIAANGEPRTGGVLGGTAAAPANKAEVVVAPKRAPGRPAGTTKEALAARKVVTEPVAEANEFDDPVEPEAVAEGVDDEWPDDEPAANAEVEVTKDVMREKLLEYQTLTKSGDKARGFLASVTSNKVKATGQVKPAEYGAVYAATVAAIAKLSKK